MNNYTIILDISVLVVLCITIIFCLKLNGRIMSLQNNKAELEGFIKALDNAIISSHRSILNLKEMTEKTDAARQKYVSEANELANDLSMMISSGNRLMIRSDDTIEQMKEILNRLEKIREESRDTLEDKSTNKIN